jgi:ankyrin repeat protein
LRPVLRPLLVASAVLALASCQKGQNGERGGEPERQLVEATVAADLGKVEQLLAAGASPNKMAPYQDHVQSPWKLALHQVRANRPATIAIVQTMLKHGARPDIAWGEGPSRNGGYSVQSIEPIQEANTPEVTRALMQAGLDPRNATLALEEAAEAGQSEIVHILVEAGVNVNSRPTAITPLVAAIERRDYAMMVYLEDHGAREKP